MRAHELVGMGIENGVKYRLWVAVEHGRDDTV
jgi:hypothetical protein